MAEHVADPEVLLVDQRRPCLRARLEQFINTLKIDRRVATRYDHLPPRVSSASSCSPQSDSGLGLSTRLRWRTEVLHGLRAPGPAVGSLAEKGDGALR